MRQEDKLLIIALVALFAAVIARFCFGAEYGTYRKDRCEWDGQSAKLFNGLDVHHFFNQTKYPWWKNVRANTVTLHHKCQFVFHRCNFTNSVPETCVLFGRTVEGIIKECEQETGIDINGKKINMKEIGHER